jgi:hypothetical protein
MLYLSHANFRVSTLVGNGGPCAIAEPYKFGALRYRVLVTQLRATPPSLSFNLLLNTRSALRRNSNKILMFLHENFVWSSVAHSQIVIKDDIFSTPVIVDGTYAPTSVRKYMSDGSTRSFSLQ